MSVLSAYCVFILLHCVSLCSVVFLYSLSATFCLPVLTSGPFFQCEALFLHLYLRRWPHFVEVLSSCCIKALSLFFILRLHLIFYFEALAWYCIEALSSYFILRPCPHILFWGFVLIFYLRLCPHIFCWGFGLAFYFEALSSYFILRLRPRILFEASSSYFILRLHPHILFWGFGLVFYFEASSSYFILRLCPHILFILIILFEDSSSGF